MTLYEQGFITKCAEYGVDAQLLANYVMQKRAAGLGIDSLFGSGNTQAIADYYQGNGRRNLTQEQQNLVSHYDAGKPGTAMGRWWAGVAGGDRGLEAYMAKHEGQAQQRTADFQTMRNQNAQQIAAGNKNLTSALNSNPFNNMQATRTPTSPFGNKMTQFGQTR